MTREERAQKFKAEADKYLNDRKAAIIVKTAYSIEGVEVTDKSDRIIQAQAELLRQKIKGLEEKYNVSIVAPQQLQINVLYWPDEIKQMEEDAKQKRAELENELEDTEVTAENIKDAEKIDK
jgi:uncharacterized protein YaaN involved in tellurite resistance